MKPTSRTQTVLLSLAAIAAAVGFADALYLTLKHYAGGAVSCGLIEGCSVVLESSWATIFKIPTAAFGALYYGLLLVSLGTFFFTRRVLFLQLSLALVTVGLVVSAGFLYLQIFVINALCQFCLLSLLTTVAGWCAVFSLSRSKGDIIKQRDE